MSRRNGFTLINLMAVVVVVALVVGVLIALLSHAKSVGDAIRAGDTGTGLRVHIYKGHEYLTNRYDGGIIHSESCPCKTGKVEGEGR